MQSITLKGFIEILNIYSPDAAEREAAKEKKADDQNDSGVESPNPAKEKTDQSDASTATEGKSKSQSEDKDSEIKPVAKG